GGLVLDGAPQAAQRVDVLDLAARAELGVAAASHRDVAVDAHRAFFHLAVGGADGDEDRPELRDVGASLVDGAQVGLADDLEQRHAGAVVVDERVGGVVDPTAAADVRRLAGVLLEVGPLDAGDLAVRQLEPALGV